MNININASQIKREFGDSGTTSVNRLCNALSLEADPVGYITRQVSGDFYPANIKKLAEKASAVHKLFIGAQIVMNTTLCDKEKKDKGESSILFNGKNHIDINCMQKQLISLAKDDKNAFEKFKIEYIKWNSSNKNTRPGFIENVVNYFVAPEKIVGPEVADQIEYYLENTIYNDNLNKWEIK